ncbi:disease resistance-like protein DSC1 [Senna tora]|uniref:Disease resistance-like protein DSC1 n=1 Tax=Senna tora TaxID=362788 RepID=A0A834TBU2_9FABA|nr:disease resistance-like protein DSC1 [Senna tora]
MCELKFLNVVQPYPEEQILSLPQGLQTLPNGLRFLHWISYPLKSLPSTFYPESLVELKMPHSRLEKLWEGVLMLFAKKGECGPQFSEKLSFEFFAQSGSAWGKRDDIVIKECGVCPVYDSEYQKFMKEMEMELESEEAKAIEGCSKQPNKNKYMFPSLPVGTWKVGTKGLKDIISSTSHCFN